MTVLQRGKNAVPDLLDRLKTVLADRYAIDEEIGSGGMATVYLAEDLKHRRKVAVKVLRPELVGREAPESRPKNPLVHSEICAVRKKRWGVPWRVELPQRAAS